MKVLFSILLAALISVGCGGGNEPEVELQQFTIEKEKAFQTGMGYMGEIGNMVRHGHWIETYYYADDDENPTKLAYGDYKHGQRHGKWVTKEYKEFSVVQEKLFHPEATPLPELFHPEATSLPELFHPEATSFHPEPEYKYFSSFPETDYIIEDYYDNGTHTKSIKWKDGKIERTWTRRK